MPLNQETKNNFAGKNYACIKICRNLVLFPEKISEYAADIKISFKELTYAFLRSNVFVF